MGGEPPLEQDPEGRDDPPVEARGRSVGHLLGEQWQTDGDGIYRLVEEPDPPHSPPAGPADVDDLIAELTADLGRR